MFEIYEKPMTQDVDKLNMDNLDPSDDEFEIL